MVGGVGRPLRVYLFIATKSPVLSRPMFGVVCHPNDAQRQTNNVFCIKPGICGAISDEKEVFRETNAHHSPSW